jgi:hypothetical protein
MLDPMLSVLPIVIVPFDGGKPPKPQPSHSPDMRHWQIEEFLRQTEKAENTGGSFNALLPGAISPGLKSLPAISASFGVNSKGRG